MPTVIESIRPDQLALYASVPMICHVDSVLVVAGMHTGADGFYLHEIPVSVPYDKDYDACPDGGPLDWPKQFDLANWAFWLARQGDQLVGAAAVAWNTSALQMLENRSDLAVLWDIRVRDSSRRQGVATALFATAARWAQAHACHALRIETQNVNVPACRFYARMGCSLARIDRHAYAHIPQLAHETMLLWHRPLPI